MPPIRSLPVPSDVLKQSQFTSLQEKMSKDLFSFDAEQRKNNDALALENIGNLHLPEDGGVTGMTGYESMLGDTAAPDTGEAAPEAAPDYGAAPEAPRRATALMSPTLDMPAMTQPRQQPVYDPVQTVDIQGPPDYDPSADTGDGTVPSSMSRDVPPVSRSVPGTASPPSPSPTGEIDNSSRQAFITSAWPYMLEAAGGNRDTAEMMLAAAISENGSVGSGKPLWANNFFGIKGAGDAGSVDASTHEIVNGARQDITDTFAAYSTPVAGFRAFFDFLEKNPRYERALGAYRTSGDAAQLFRDVNMAGYATDPQWASKVENIRQNQVAPIVAGIQTPAPSATQRAAEGRNLAGETQTGAIRVVPNAQPDSYWTSGGTHGGAPAADIFAPAGSPIMAPVGGVSTPAVYPSGGNATIIKGDDGRYYYMAHGKVPFVGGRIEAGQQIGQVGNTGNAAQTASHLHYAIATNPSVFDQHNGSGDITGDAYWQTPTTASAQPPQMSRVPLVGESGAPIPSADPIARREADARALAAGPSPADSPPAPPVGTSPLPAGGSPLDAARAQDTGGGLLLKDAGAGPPARDDWRNDQQTPIDPDQGPHELIPPGQVSAPPIISPPIDPDQGPHELIPPGQVSAPPIISPLAPNENPGVSVTASRPAPPSVTITSGGPPTPSAQYVAMPVTPTPVAPPAPQVPEQATPWPQIPGLQPVLDGAGNVVAWVQGQAQAAGQQINENMAGNRQAVVDANAGRTGGVDFGTGAQNAAEAAVPVLDAVTGPGGLLEPAGGAIRTTARLSDLQNAAAAELGRSPIDPRVLDDPGWRLRHPDLAVEVDDLRHQSTLSLMGQVGDVPRAPRALPEPRGVAGEIIPRPPTAHGDVIPPAADPPAQAWGIHHQAEALQQLVDATPPASPERPVLIRRLNEAKNEIGAILEDVESRLDDAKEAVREADRAWFENPRSRAGSTYDEVVGEPLAELDAVQQERALYPPTPTSGPLSPADRAAMQAGETAPAETPLPQAQVVRRVPPADAGVQHLGSGFVPEPPRGRPTVEVLQEQLSAAQRAVQSARRLGDDGAVRVAQDEAARVESALVDAMNARRRLEPAITSDVGRRVETLPLPEETADTFSGAGSRPGAARPEDLSGPVSHVPSRINLNAGFAPSRATLFNAAQGGVLGAVSENLQAQEEGRPVDPTAQLWRGVVGAGLGIAAGRHLVRQAPDHVGSGFGHVPEPGTPNRAIAVGSDPSRRYEFRYRVADLNDLIPSNTATGAPNPAFPRELQPRERSRAASQLQIDRIAQNLEPDALLNDFGRLDVGPMIVGPDNLVESGNGRVLGLQRAASQHPENYQRYVAALRSQLDEYGLTDADLHGVEHPVLVRERVSDVDRPAFVQEANSSSTQRMSGAETAAQSAGKLSDDVVSNLDIGENDTIASALRKTENRDIVRQWVGSMPHDEASAFLDTDGNISPAGYDQLANALLVRTYGEGAGTRAFIESADPEVRNVQVAIMGSLPDVARAEALIRSGQRDASLSVAPDVAAATEVLARLKRTRTSVGDYLSQAAMGERELTPFQENVLQFLDQNQRRPSAIRQALREYADVVEHAADPNQVDMFGGAVAATTKEDAWASATAGAQRERQARIAARQATSQAEYAARTPAGEIIPSTGGPEGRLAQEGAPPRRAVPTEAPRGALPQGGPEGALSQQPGVPEQVRRQFQERIHDPEKADAAAVAYQGLVDSGASPEAIATFLRNSEDSRWWDRFDILRYASMLSDPVTHGQNILGNLQMSAVDVAERPLTALLDKGRARITGGPREAFMSEGAAQVIGMAHAAPQALRDAAFIMQHGLRPEDVAKLDTRTRGFGTNIPGIAPRGSKAAAVGDFLAEGPLRALGAADALFRGTMRGGHLSAEAERAARIANGGKPVTPEQVGKAMLDPDVGARAEARAAQAVFQEDRQVTSAINAGRNRLPPLGQAALSVAVPYIKTPYNMMAQGMGMTPAGFLAVANDLGMFSRVGGKTLRAPVNEIERRVSRMLIGGGVMAWASLENLQGLNTGAYPEKESARSTLPPGWRPYSRKVTVGGQTYYVPLALMGPLAIPSMLSILLTEQAKKGGPMTSEKAATVAEGVGQMAEDQTFLRSVADFSAAMTKGGNTAMNYAERQASQFSPHLIGGGGIGRRVQAILGQPARDPDGVVQAWLATLPYGDQLANTLGVEKAAVRRDVLGRPSVTNPDGAAALVPIRASREHDAVIIRAYRQAGEGLPRFAPTSIRDPDTERSIVLTPRQKERWQIVFGQELQSEWSAQGNPRDAEDLRKVERAARERAADAVLGR